MSCWALLSFCLFLLFDGGNLQHAATMAPTMTNTIADSKQDAGEPSVTNTTATTAVDFPKQDTDEPPVTNTTATTVADKKKQRAGNHGSHCSGHIKTLMGINFPRC
ncbi:hypothetical protein AAFF_G00384380 [Aldrovandia affinis]|uniref:Uncharacterized protein n=1 Tax=Aldrovandia affinis TaxID=143900 RepID=A0AAD7WMI9_9TELE|nr:hypothetical protein AAFF_G00384380 [Aldrovandia affinis]